MPPVDLAGQLTAPTTRRTVVKTGIKLAYAAPLVAATFKLSEAAVAAQVCTIDSCNGPEQTCGANPGCFCTSTTEGNLVCGQFTGGGCSTYQLCTTSAGCPGGQICAPGPDCCGGICLSLCDGTISGAGAGAATEPTPGQPPFA